jgi:protease-4
MLRIFRKGKIGILKIHGTIGSNIKYEQIYPLILKIKKNKSIKVLILDINSPGGGVTDSDLIFSSLNELNKTKPVIAYVQGLGASGGYLVACASRRIIASEASILGSIGVISVRPVLSDLLNKLGVKINVNKTGEYKDSGSTWRKQTKNDSVYLQEFIDDYYTRFIQIVSKNRKEDIATIKEIADGKIYWAPKAKELGLIDEIGDINTAINYASKIGKCSKDIVLFKPKVSFLRKFVGNAASSFYDELSNKLLAERINLN